jgi:phosphoglycerate kinase
MKTIDDLDVDGQRVLVRADFNVPLAGPTITDDGRIRASLPTLNELISRRAKVIVCSHLGRPKGVRDPRYSLDPVAVRLGQLLGRPVVLAADTAGPAARTAVAALGPGETVLLENVRFNPGETASDDAVRGEFAGQLAELADLYVGDGFSAMHRRHASVFDLPARLPHAAGYLVQAETAALRRLTTRVEKPYVLILGGAKVPDKLAVVGNLLGAANEVIVGGAMAFPFLGAQGHPVGTSPVAQDDIEIARRCLDQAAAAGTEILLPADLIVAPDRGAAAPRQTVSSDDVPADQMALDIGPASIKLFEAALSGARIIFWNGPMGVFELEPYADGTREIARAVTASAAFTVVGGGDTAAAVRQLGFADAAFGHVSTGGGASLEYLQGKTLPGLAALEA